MSAKSEWKSTRKRRDWRAVTVTVLLGFLTAIVLWTGIIWIGLKME
ncbi:hypothetical protein [Paenibacillus rigui]|nr:hypothetical protein [Paenibacillus rigui]